MDRRIARSGLAAILALAPVAASAETTPQSTGPAVPQGLSAGPAPSASTGPTEAMHVKRTMTTGALSLQLSRIALGRLKNDDLKAFAQFEIAEQEGIAHVLKTMQEPESTASTTASPASTPLAPSEAEVQANLDVSGKQVVEKMRTAGNGPEFDRMYLQAQIQGHNQLLHIQEDYLKTGRNRESRNVALLSSVQIREHIALLKDLQDDLKDD